MQLQNIEIAVRDRMGVASTDGVLTSAVLIRLINRALARFSAEADWPWLETKVQYVITSTGKVTFAADTIRIMAAKVDSVSHTMDEISLEMANKLDVATVATDKLMFYTITGSEILFRPAPVGSTDVDVWYLRSEAALVNATDEPYVPDNQIEPVIEYAASLGFRQVRDVSQAGVAFDAYDVLVAKALSRISRASSSEGGARNATQIGEPGATG